MFTSVLKLSICKPYELHTSGRDSWKIPSPNIDTVFSYEDESQYLNQRFDDFGEEQHPVGHPWEFD